MAYLYQHRRLDTNEIFYIGIGSTKQRAYITCNRTNHWKRIVNKYGYKVELLEVDISWEEACQKEIELIKFYGKLYNNTGNLINITDGGDGVLGRCWTKEQTEKRLKSRGNHKHSEESKEKMRNSALGRKNKPESKLKSALGHMKDILDTSTGIFYKGVGEAAKAYNLNISTLRCKLTGHLRNNTNLIYIANDN